MDATVTVKYFRVLKPTAQAPNFETTLQNLADLDLPGREVTVEDGVTLRLERFGREATYFIGEFCRVQSENIPPTASDTGLSPTVLSAGRGLGHVAAFRYHVPTKILLLQANLQCATANRICAYLGTSGGKPLYSFEPLLRIDAFKRLGKSEVRAFTVKFAEPQNIEALDDPKLSALAGVRQAASLLNAREITITIAAGKKKKKEKRRPRILQEQTRTILSKLSKLSVNDDVDILKAQVSEDTGAKWLDLLEEQMKYSERLKLPSGAPDNNYEIRKNYLARVFNGNIAELNELYGERDDGD